MSTPRLHIQDLGEFLKYVVSRITTQLFKKPDPNAIISLSGDPFSMPLAGIGIGGTDEQPRLGALSTVPESRINFEGRGCKPKTAELIQRV
jgi:hypothetical protein